MMKLNEKGQALNSLQGTVLGIVSTVAILGVGYAVISGIRDSAGTNLGNATHPVYDSTYTAVNSGMGLLDTVQNNLGIIITISVFSVILVGVTAFGAFRR